MNPDNIGVNEYVPNVQRTFSSPMTVIIHFLSDSHKTVIFDFQTEAVLLKDAVKVFTRAFESNETFVSDFKINPSSCYEMDPNLEPSSTSKDLLKYVDEVIRSIPFKYCD